MTKTIFTGLLVASSFAMARGLKCEFAVQGEPTQVSSQANATAVELSSKTGFYKCAGTLVADQVTVAISIPSFGLDRVAQGSGLLESKAIYTEAPERGDDGFIVTCSCLYDFAE